VDELDPSDGDRTLGEAGTSEEAEAVSEDSESEGMGAASIEDRVEPELTEDARSECASV
jgi:hypothetical protein